MYWFFSIHCYAKWVNWQRTNMHHLCVSKTSGKCSFFLKDCMAENSMKLKLQILNTSLNLKQHYKLTSIKQLQHLWMNILFTCNFNPEWILRILYYSCWKRCLLHTAMIITQRILSDNHGRYIFKDCACETLGNREQTTVYHKYTNREQTAVYHKFTKREQTAVYHKFISREQTAVYHKFISREQTAVYHKFISREQTAVYHKFTKREQTAVYHKFISREQTAVYHKFTNRTNSCVP